MTETSPDGGPAGVLRRWHEAVNAQDLDTAVALCHDDVEVGGPRGTATGRDAVRAWLTRSGISLEPQHPLTEDAGRPGRFVVHELARWRTTADAPAQAPTDAPAETWVVFAVRDGRLASLVRYESEDDVPPA